MKFLIMHLFQPPLTTLLLDPNAFVRNLFSDTFN